MQPPKASISVIMPSLNGRHFIETAIRSVLSQDVDELELVIQDGGSTDGTRELVESLADPRVRIVSEPDRGQADALNRAVGRARGEWILWLNADDELARGVLPTLAPALSDGHDLIYGDFGIIDEHGTVVKEYETPDFSFKRILDRGAYIFSGSMLVRREVIEQVGGFDEHLGYCMDYDFLCKIAPRVKPRYHPGIVAYLRDHAATKSRRQPWSFLRERWIVSRRHGAPLVSTVQGQVVGTLYLLAGPLRRSRHWRQLHPRKRL